MQKNTKKKSSHKYKKNVVIQSYLVLLPQIVGFFVFSIYPIFWVVKYSFTDYNGFKGQFVGLSNYIDLFLHNRTYWSSVGNVLIITGMKMLLEIPLAFLLAMLLNWGRLRGKRAFSVLLFLPSVMSVSSAGMIFAYIFRTYNGMMNNLLISLGLLDAPVNWLAGKWTAMIVIVLMSTWMTFPVNMMYFCGAVAGVPQEVYESAKLDGCVGFKKIIYITLPLIAPTFKVILMLALTGTMKVLSDVKVLTDGGPKGQTDVVMLYLYRLFFESTNPRIGYASAGSVIMTIMIALITVVYLKASKKLDELC